MAPPTNCLSPIGEKAILAGLYRQIKGDFYTAVSRPPAVYRGNPFVIEAGLAYGRGPEQAAESQEKKKIPLAEGEQRTTTVSSPASSATPTACRSCISSLPARSINRCWRPPGAPTAYLSPKAPCRLAPW